MSIIAGLLMQTVTQNHFAAPSTVGTVEARNLVYMLLSLFFFPSATLFAKMLFAFVSAIFTIIFIRFVQKILI